MFPSKDKEGFDFMIPTIKIWTHVTHGYTLCFKLGKVPAFWHLLSLRLEHKGEVKILFETQSRPGNILFIVPLKKKSVLVIMPHTQ